MTCFASDPESPRRGERRRRRGAGRSPRFHPARSEDDGAKEQSPDDFASLLSRYCQDRNITPKPVSARAEGESKYTQEGTRVEPEFDAR